MNKFSDRLGLQPTPEVSVRDGAPAEFRGVLVDLALKHGCTPSPLRTLVCDVLMLRQDSSNWSDDRVAHEVREKVDSCPWYEVYDLAEAIYGHLCKDFRTAAGGNRFQVELNQYFLKSGIGWQLADGHIRSRETPEFELALLDAARSLRVSSMRTSALEIEQALADLSRRPEPDLTGALQHALAALECCAREVTGNPKETLGRLLTEKKDLFPSPLNVALEKLWGFASERGRHLREGRVPPRPEAVFVVHIAAAAANYLATKTSSILPTMTDGDESGPLL